MGDLPSVVLVCAAIYLLAVVVGRRGSAWIGFVASLPIIGLGIALRMPSLSLALLAVASVVLVVVGTVRGTWRSADGRRQLVAVIVFGALAVAAAVVEAPVPVTVLVVVGLVAHGVWDIWHHRRDAVVARPYAEFCAVLDLALAAAIVVRAAVTG